MNIPNLASENHCIVASSCWRMPMSVCGSRAMTISAVKVVRRKIGIRFIDLTRVKNEPSVFELPFQNFAGNGGVGLAFAQLHHLAFEEIQCGTFAGFEISRRAGIGGDGFVAEFLNRSRVAHLCEAFFLA